MPVLSLSYFEPSNVLLDDPEMMHVPLQMVVRTEGCLGYVIMRMRLLCASDF